MLNRRQLLKSALGSAPLLALGSSVPQFVARAALAAAETKPTSDNILVVIELAGGNDALNMVVPYGDDLYHKARPTLRIKKEEIIRVDDLIGLNPALRPMEPLLSGGQLAMVQGVGYPNPSRSHFDSMDYWHTADPAGRVKTGWLGRSLGVMPSLEGKIPALYIGNEKLPLAMQGSGFGVPAVNPGQTYGLELGQSNDPAAEENAREKKEPQPAGSLTTRKQLVRELTTASTNTGSMADFVRRVSLETYDSIDRLNEQIAKSGAQASSNDIAVRLQMVANMINSDFGARVYFVSLSGFDTHSDQRQEQDKLFGQLATGIQSFFGTLAEHAGRVSVMTFSEFGRRVSENDSKGTDHGAAAALFVAGPGVKGGLVGDHPSLKELDDGDIKFKIDFRRVYASILQDWLKCDSEQVLGAKYETLPLFKGSG